MTSAEGSAAARSPVAGAAGEPGGCDACHRRAWLLARLSGFIEVARHERRALRDVLALDDEDLIRAVAATQAPLLLAEREAVDPASLRAALAVAGLGATCRHEPAYPPRLHEDSGGPALLTVAGMPRLGLLLGGRDSEAPPAIAIVGTRKASHEGLEVARVLGRGLSAAGVTVVSGMALGIDSAAHAGALEGGGRTVAVLASGADVAYPSSKRPLYGRITQTGAVVSEMPPGTAPRKWGFPARNRTIAGLASATLVVEAAERSGSLITVDFAIALGRDVAAVPGSVLSWRSRGTNALLRDGATLIREARDALDLALGLDAADAADVLNGVRPVPPDLAPHLRALLAEVDAGRDTVGALALTPGHLDAVVSGLGELELLGLLRRGPGGRYTRTML